ncbi:GntR family transcriptional regulator [Paracoccus sediminis]|uniref:DNA-binding transcriptional regulator, GntR family n=1 Tax=Paracoccus sediminis TaxID=1214787 RepID=A0A238WZE0_9RHOB|nr:GntR family transcriptional regulator [Paracoccus sediminis]TBN50090.1 GntR family transcriptional regulator [Paracoccus sediminis]SNR50979.1 DNA-binding transcriptional regulator, GntR family [Paracoccus sediminis]
MAENAENLIVDGVIEAILERRLRAGTKLSEPELCEIYDCSRTDVRRALVILATRKTVELRRNRGAFVRVPSQPEARNVFQARRAIEKTLARNAAQHAKKIDLAALDKVVQAEIAARESGDRARAIRLSGEFHMVLAKIGQNDVLAEFLHELVMRSSLIIGLFSGSNHVLCQDDEHGEIAAAIQRGDGIRASDLLEAHLRHIEAQLIFDTMPEASDLRHILGR